MRTSEFNLKGDEVLVEVTYAKPSDEKTYNMIEDKESIKESDTSHPPIDFKMDSEHRREHINLRDISSPTFDQTSPDRLLLPTMFPPRTTGRPSDSDSAIRETDNDAALARLSAVRRSYLDDPYIRHLVPRAHLVPPRPPLINIGTYVRSSALDALIHQWLQISQQTGQKSQIVSLGAGSDTRFWRTVASSLGNHLKTYVELDFPEITTKKAMGIKKSKELMAGLDEVTLGQGGTALHSEKYHLLPVDLRKDPSEILDPLLFSANAAATDHSTAVLDPSLPTLLVFECVLVYMSPESSDRLLRWFVEKSSTQVQAQTGLLGCIVYEMFGLNDSFGRVMVNNLKERGISLPGVIPYATIESLPNRFLQTGFSAARALSLKDIRRSYITQDELNRISSLEFLDETEELDLLLSHYAISWGLFLSKPEVQQDWGHWGLRQQTE